MSTIFRIITDEDLADLYQRTGLQAGQDLESSEGTRNGLRIDRGQFLRWAARWEV